MDPQQRLFLNVTLQALEDAGLDTFSDTNNSVGVFVGAATNQYHTITDPVYGDPFQRANRGFVAPCISARTAYHLNLHGPNVTINTNCASSTVALSLAVDALRSHRCDVAVVGGVSVQLFE
jgi:acyl transferase domain-containing protein